MNGLSIAALQHPKTTAGGVLALLAGLGLIAMQVKAVVGGQEANGEQLALAVGLLGAGWAAVWAKDGDKSNAASPVKATSTVAKVVALLLMAGLAGVAQAQDAAAAPGTTGPASPAVITLPAAPKVSIELGSGWSLQGGLGLGGAGLTKVGGRWQIVRNVQLAGLLEIGTPWKVADPILGPAWQTGESQGWGATFGGVEKLTGLSLSLTASPLVVGGKVAWSYFGGTVLRY